MAFGIPKAYTKLTIGADGKNKYGYPIAIRNAAKNKAKQALILRAKRRGMIPYSGLVKEISSKLTTRVFFVSWGRS